MVTAKDIESYVKAEKIQLNKEELEKFKTTALLYDLNPFKREVYCSVYNTKKGRKLSIITGYEVYLKRAERCGHLNGWNVKIDGSREDGSMKASITIYRDDWDHPLTHEVWFSEYAQNNNMWQSKPLTMLRKVAMAQGFRLAFPDELGGMPYTTDELPDNMTSAPEKPPQASPGTSEGDSKEMYDKIGGVMKSGVFSEDEIASVREACKMAKGDNIALEAIFNTWTARMLERQFKGKIETEQKELTEEENGS